MQFIVLYDFTVISGCFTQRQELPGAASMTAMPAE
jgi:hypothetical protein